MKIKEWITHEVVTINPEASVKEAFALLKSMGIRHLPVVKNAKLYGIVTDRDLRRPKISDVFLEWDELYQINDAIQVEDIMAAPAITISEDSTIKEAAKIMAQNRIGALPVTNKKGTLAGIITESDILRAFASGKK
jgi:acetoin utilization protein AcuB